MHTTPSIIALPGFIIARSIDRPVTFVIMHYFKRLQDLLKMEKEADRQSFQQLSQTLSVSARRENGICWYPIAIKDTELGRGDYLTVELERTTHQDIYHQLRFGMSAALFSNHDAKNDRVEGTIVNINGNRLKINLRTDELPDWSRNGKLGIDAVFDDKSYAEMEAALKLATTLSEKEEEGHLIKVLVGEKKPTFHNDASTHTDFPFFPFCEKLNSKQRAAVKKIIEANELAIIHGPPGTGKTTTLVEAIKTLVQNERSQILVVAPSNAAVDLLSEKLNDEGIKVVRIGNPARVADKQLLLTLDSKVAAHASSKEMKKLKKQATEFRDMAQKYKRSFGRAEREQRKALFTEASNIRKEVERTEEYIINDVLARAQVITATLVGANHYSVRNLKYKTVVIDEAAQAIEPACWIPVLKAKKIILAGDHLQLPPTIKSTEATPELSNTLMEKLVSLYPEAVVLLEEQYRMHQTIAGFSSQEFYNGQLTAYPSVAEHLLFADDKPLLFIDTAGCGFDEQREVTQLSNPEEAQFLMKQLNNYVVQLQQFYPVTSFPAIGVISPYRHQVETLKEAVTNFPELMAVSRYLSISTIDSFQGQERDAMFISLTRSNADATIGFLSEVRRMNVALTRARKKLVVIGDSATISQFNFYADFIAYAQAHEAYVSAWELME